MIGSASLESLRGRVAWVRRIGLARSAAWSAAAATAAAAASFLAVSALDVLFWLPVPLRLAGLAVTCAATTMIARMIWKRSAGDVGLDRAARTVEARYPEIGRSLSTAIEFGSDPERAGRLSSPDLVSALVARTEARAEGVDFRRAVDWRGVLRWLLLSAALLAIAGLYWTALPQLAGPSLARLVNPVGDIAPPTWTVIHGVEPGDAEVRRGSSPRVEVRLGGVKPGAVHLSYRTRGTADWSEVEMAEVNPGSHARTLVNVTQPVEYMVRAGDARSRVFAISPVEEPRVKSLRVTVAPPGYTGLDPERLPEGAGDVRAVEGSVVRMEVTPTDRAVAAIVRLRPDGEEDSARELAPNADGAFTGEFRLLASGEYEIELTDSAGRTNDATRVAYRMHAAPDRPPTVEVTSPRPDVMAAADQDVLIELRARDDWGLAEYGLVLNVTGARERVMVERPASGVREAAGSHTLRLGLRGLRGGEVISYHAYARDANDVTGPGETTGELRFIRIYDEDRYGMPEAMEEREPRAAREIGRLVDKQMDAMRAAFDAARGSAPAEGAAGLQAEVRRELAELIQRVRGDERAELSSADLLLLESAAQEMSKAELALNEGRAEDAFDPGAKALAMLSRARRIVLSEHGSGGGMAGPLDDANRERESRHRAERRRDLDELEEEARRMPPMLERARRDRRRLERLADEPPAPREMAQMADRQDRMAQSLREQASRLGEASRRDEDVSGEPRRRLLEAAEELEASAEAARRGDSSSAAGSSRAAEDAMEQAEASARRSLRAADQDRLSGASSRADELAREQRSLADREPEPDVAAAQERLRAGLDELRDELSSISNRARREGRGETGELDEAQFRLERAAREMDRAERALRGGRTEEVPGAQERAAGELGALAQALDRAGERSRTSERESLAETARQAGEMASRADRLAQASRGTAEDAAAIARGVSELGGDAESLSRAAMLLPGGAGGDIDEARQALDRARSGVERSTKALERADRAAAADELDQAREEYARAAESLRRGASRDIERTVTEAAQAARRAAEAQERSIRSGDDSVLASAEARRSAEEAARAERGLASAARAATAVRSEVAELAERESARAGRERLSGQIAEHGDRLARGEAERAEAERLLDEARRMSARAESLAAEARGDEVQALGRLAEDAAAAAERIEALREDHDAAIGKELDARSRREMAMRAEGIAGDIRNMRARLARRAPEALAESVKGGTLSTGELFDAAEGELVEMARRLSRNQERRATAALGGGAAAHRVAGRRVIALLEEAMRRRDLRAPEDEAAPEDYRELVEQYFRALSED